jgi:hypothetical protein
MGPSTGATENALLAARKAVLVDQSGSTTPRAIALPPAQFLPFFQLGLAKDVTFY